MDDEDKTELPQKKKKEQTACSSTTAVRDGGTFSMTKNIVSRVDFADLRRVAPFLAKGIAYCLHRFFFLVYKLSLARAL